MEFVIFAAILFIPAYFCQNPRSTTLVPTAAIFDLPFIQALETDANSSSESPLNTIPAPAASAAPSINEQINFTAIIKQTTSSTTTTTPLPIETTTQSPKEVNTSHCFTHFNLTDSRSACLVAYPRIFELSLNDCVVLNMTLLTVRSDSDEKRVFEETKKIFSVGGGTLIYINGKYSHEKEEWLRQPSNETLKWQRKLESPMKRFENKSAEYCLTVQSRIGEKHYEIAGIRCSNACYYYCEFDSKDVRWS